MKNILSGLIRAIAWLGGAVFFISLGIYILISFLAKRVRKLFGAKELHHFRENEFPLLDVINNSGKNVPVGKLPAVKEETYSYHIPVIANEILLEFNFSGYRDDKCLEFDYCISCSDSSSKKEYVYIFINPFDDLKLSYDRALVWYPLPEDRIINVKAAGIKAANGKAINIEGQLNIVQVR